MTGCSEINILVELVDIHVYCMFVRILLVMMNDKDIPSNAGFQVSLIN